MKLTDGEKLIILMLSELHEQLDINGEIDPEFVKSAIFNDKLWGLRWKYPGIPFEEVDDPEIVKEVVDILDMWSFIEFSYQRLSDDDKATLEKIAHPFGKDPKFQGFDGNNETEYMSTAMFVVNELDRFEEFKGRNFNSHFSSIDSYKRMLSAFEPMRKQLSFEPFSAEALAAVLNEKTHPSNRDKQPNNTLKQGRD